jgi:hypothetical protein
MKIKLRLTPIELASQINFWGMFALMFFDTVGLKSLGIVSLIFQACMLVVITLNSNPKQRDTLSWRHLGMYSGIAAILSAITLKYGQEFYNTTTLPMLLTLSIVLAGIVGLTRLRQLLGARANITQPATAEHTMANNLEYSDAPKDLTSELPPDEALAETRR